MTTTYMRAPSVLWRRVADDVVVLAYGSEDLGLLSTAAAIVWEELETPRELDDLTTSLASAFERDVIEMRADLAQVLQDLRWAGLVNVVDDAERSHA